MTRVDFYVLPDQDMDARTRFAARLAEKAFRQNLSVLLLVADDAMAEELDALLWRYPPESFLPHAVSQHHSNERILLCSSAGDAPTRDLLINLAETLPENLHRFDRIAEIVVQAPPVLASTRGHYAHFKERGFEVNTHKLG